MIAVTLSELIASALAELDHPDNTAALPLWKGTVKFEDALAKIYRRVGIKDS